MKEFKVGLDNLDDLQEKAVQAMYPDLWRWEGEGGAVTYEPDVPRRRGVVLDSSVHVELAPHYADFLETFNPKAVDRLLVEIQLLRELVSEVNSDLSVDGLQRMGCGVEAVQAVRSVVDGAVKKYNEASKSS